MTDEKAIRRFRFGPFELDTSLGELRRGGIKLPIRGQPLQVLELLVRSPGELVTREALRQALWSDGTVVNFDDGLNHSVRDLRRELADPAETPTYIETIPRRGYRFLAEVTPFADPRELAPPSAAPAALDEPHVHLAPRPTRPRWRGLALGVAAVALSLGAFLFVRYGPSLRPKEPPRTAAQATPRPVVAILGVKNTLPSGQPAWLPTAIGELLAHELAAAETSLRVIPTKRVAEVRRSLGVSEDEVVDEKSRQRMEGLLVANVLVDGSLTLKEPGLDTVRVHLNVRDAQTGQARASLDEDIDAHGATLPAASIRLGARVRDALGVSLSAEQEAALAASRASSADAVQAYAQGVMSLRRFEKAEARGYFEAALTTDSSFLDAEVGTSVSQGTRRKARDVAEHIRARPSGLTSRQAAALDVTVLTLGADESKTTKARIALFDAMPDDLELGLDLADFTSDEPPLRTQLAILGRLRQLPAPSSTDLRLDLAEAEAARGLGEIGRANGLLTKMVDRAKKLGARTELGLAELERGEVLRLNETRGTDALGHFVEAERLFAEVGELEWLLYAKQRRASLLMDLGPPSRALASLDEATSLSRRLGYRGRVQELLLSSVGQLLQRGDLDGARRRVDEARLELQALGQPLTRDYFLELGHLEFSEANLQAVLAAARALQTHPLSNEALALPLEALVLREQDHVQQARESFRRAAMLWDQYGNQLVRDIIARGACSLECDEGRSAAGLACLAEHPSPVGAVDDPNTFLEEAQCRDVAGDLTGAERAARNALSQAERGERFGVRISSMVVLMHAVAARGQVAQAVSRLGAVLAEVESKHYKRLAFEVGLALGEIELKAGRPEGRVRLLKLEQEAKSREFFRIARLAREALDGKVAQAH